MVVGRTMAVDDGQSDNLAFLRDLIFG